MEVEQLHTLAAGQAVDCPEEVGPKLAAAAAPHTGSLAPWSLMETLQLFQASPRPLLHLLVLLVGRNFEEP